MNLIEHLVRQKKWSLKAFGPGDRTHGLIAHILEELKEVSESEGQDIEEWIDVVILAFDGAWRAGFTPYEIAKALKNKQEKNENRKWPDWRQFTNGEAINHIKED
jgi:hypothetical protein